MAHVDIGPDVMVSSGVAFIGDDHPFQGLDGPITAHPANQLSQVTIHGDSLIGFGAIVLGSVEIGRGAIVAAGAVVTSDLKADTVYAGVPARPISPRRRGSDPSGAVEGV
ncbi:acyltransferase [Oryzobacter telluris]|uniref:acyltransferase n=1 Tax=Oryzobacter telluris TaxID=3149179 RepID=UPI00370D02FA